MDKSRLLVATRNEGKLRELSPLLGGVPYRLVSLDDVGIDFDVKETGSTFKENAVLKATAYCRASGLLTVADDSGLEVDVLGGDPGVRSARYAGEDASDVERNELLLRNLSTFPRETWTARFRCAIAIAMPDSEDPAIVEGQVEGLITDHPRGDNGFGYDPVFYLPDLSVTMAELPSSLKNELSHRGIAARKAVETLKRLAAVS